MPRESSSTEQVVTRLPQTEVELGRGLAAAAGLQDNREQWTDVRPLSGRRRGDCRWDQTKRLKEFEREYAWLKWREGARPWRTPC